MQSSGLILRILSDFLSGVDGILLMLRIHLFLDVVKNQIASSNFSKSPALFRFPSTAVKSVSSPSRELSGDVEIFTNRYSTPN